MIGKVIYKSLCITWVVQVNDGIIEAIAEQQFNGVKANQKIKVGNVVHLRPPKWPFHHPFITRILDERDIVQDQSMSQEKITMTHAVAILTVLGNYPIGNHTDSETRGLLILAQKLAVQLGTSGTGNSPAQITLDFLAAQLDDGYLVEKCKQELNYLVEKFSRGA